MAVKTTFFGVIFVTEAEHFIFVIFRGLKIKTEKQFGKKMLLLLAGKCSFNHYL